MDFSWSKSRATTFAECHRKYYYQYYAYQGGWFSTAAPLARQTYILRSLDTLPSWVGRLVHESLASTLRDLQAAPDARPVALGRSLARLRRRMEAQFAFSAERRYWYTTKRNAGDTWRALAEHEFNLPLRHDELDHAFVRAAHALASFTSSPLWDSIVDRSDRTTWLAIDTPSIITVAGAKVWCVPDFVFTDPDTNQVNVIDWKTGAPSSGHSNQLIPYAAAVALKHGVALDSIVLRPVYPGHYDDTSTVTSDSVKTWLAEARMSIDAMRTLDNQPIDAFPLTTDSGTCRSCNFRGVCFPEVKHDNPPSRLPIVTTGASGV